MPTFNYKIRNKDGLFSSGGADAEFVKTGKVWKTIGHVHSHIANLATKGRKSYREPGVEVVEYEMIETRTIPIEDAIAKQQDNRDKREEQDRLARQRRREKLETRVGK